MYNGLIIIVYQLCVLLCMISGLTLSLLIIIIIISLYSSYCSQSSDVRVLIITDTNINVCCTLVLTLYCTTCVYSGLIIIIKNNI